MEFQLLTGIELAAIDPEGIPWPPDTFGVVVIEDDKVVGRSAILNLPMIEGTYVSPEKRGGSLLFKLIARVEQLYRSLGKTHAFAMAQDEKPEIHAYLERLGYSRFPVTLYAKDLTAKKETE